MLSKLPKFEKPVLSTFSPYDINRLSNEMIHEEEEAKKAARMRQTLMSPGGPLPGAPLANSTMRRVPAAQASQLHMRAD
ncbi:hypothetical protein ANCCEY_04767 [Ancylostoma ceylanicum]|uniref:Uncharacterized protein n=1 Tax=Ancylostoma ceylanicum TaxID=53326 RepID=A0A0D6M1E0_9BILA|nr:hypothetical protein ANCCEY_04767 [Ancylostoma ceylanicum]